MQPTTASHTLGGAGVPGGPEPAVRLPEVSRTADALDDAHRPETTPHGAAVPQRAPPE